MTTKILTGTKQEIAQALAALEGDVREAVVFIEDEAASPAKATPPAGPLTEEDIFAEMDPYVVRVGDADYSRESIYSRDDEA